MQTLILSNFDILLQERLQLYSTMDKLFYNSIYQAYHKHTHVMNIWINNLNLYQSSWNYMNGMISNLYNNPNLYL